MSVPPSFFNLLHNGGAASVTGINGPVSIPGMQGYGFGGGFLPQLLARAMAGGGLGQVGLGQGLPQAARPPVQLPQLTQLPNFLPQAPGFNPAAGPGGAPPGQMPFIQNSMMANVLGPLMKPNYGNPIIPPTSPGAAAPPGFGGGMPSVPAGRFPPFGGVGIQPIQSGAQSLY